MEEKYYTVRLQKHEIEALELLTSLLWCKDAVELEYWQTDSINQELNDVLKDIEREESND